MPEQDAVAQWKAFSPEQRQSALSRMTPEQKQNLKTRIESQKTPQKPNPVGNTGITMGAASGPMPAFKHNKKFDAPLSERIAARASEPLPMIGATMGAVAGGPVGAGVGAAAGTAAQQGIDTGKVDLKAAGISGVENAALEYAGGAIGSKLAKVAAKAGPRAAEIVNNYLGLNKGKLPKFGRTVQNAREIAQTVMEKVGIKPNLEAQKAAIETTRAAYDDATKRLMQAPGVKQMDVHSLVFDRADRLTQQVERGEFPQEAKSAVYKNFDDMLKVAKPGGMMNPGEMHAMRKEIQHQITDWNPETQNVRQRFLQGVYHDLNDSIARTLPPKESRQFLANNRIQSKLITARNAADATLHKAADRSGPGLATRTMRMGTRAAIGATVGGVGGSEVGHGKEGAILGAVAGAVTGKAAEGMLPRSDVVVQKALGKTAAALAKVSKATPQVVRTLNAIQAIQSRPQQ